MSDKRNTIGQYSEAPYWRDRAKQAERERDEWKHKFEVADRIAKKACDTVFSQELYGEDWSYVISEYKENNQIVSEYGDDVITEDMLYNYLQEQAERETSIENNDKT